MISLLIEDVKPCMNGLLRGNNFDNFLFHSIDLKVLNDFHIDGEINSEYLNDQEKETGVNQNYLNWKDIRPLITTIIKAHRTPLFMQINFILSESSTEKVLVGIPDNLKEIIQSFSFRIHFESNILRLITATNYKGFLPDKSAEHSFDQSMKQFLNYYGYVYHEE